MKNSYLTSSIAQFKYYKALGEKAMYQLPDEAFFWQYNAESNSIAVIVNHIAGNMLSRFTDFLTSDGEKPWRNRDQEFENTMTSRQEMLDRWNTGWSCLLNALDQLTDDDLETGVYIRHEKHTVTEAINRQLAHYPYHIGQIVYIGRMVAAGRWKSLSIPRNQSDSFNEKMLTKAKERRESSDDV